MQDAKLGRPPKEPGPDDPVFRIQLEAVLLHSLLCGFIFAALAGIERESDDSKRLISPVSKNTLEDVLKVAWRRAERDYFHPGELAKVEITSDDLTAFGGARPSERGGGVRKTAGRLVSRALGYTDGWFARHVAQGDYYPKPLQSGRADLALLPPLIEPYPRAYIDRLLEYRLDAIRADELRRFAISWNRLMRDEKHVETRRAGIEHARMLIEARGQVLPGGLDRVFFCEECAIELGENDFRFCSDEHSAIASRRRRGRA